jgi:hypothetical protein
MLRDRGEPSELISLPGPTRSCDFRESIPLFALSDFVQWSTILRPFSTVAQSTCVVPSGKRNEATVRVSSGSITESWRLQLSSDSARHLSAAISYQFIWSAPPGHSGVVTESAPLIGPLTRWSGTLPISAVPVRTGDDRGLSASRAFPHTDDLAPAPSFAEANDVVAGTEQGVQHFRWMR